MSEDIDLHISKDYWVFISRVSVLDALLSFPSHQLHSLRTCTIMLLSHMVTLVNYSVRIGLSLILVVFFLYPFFFSVHCIDFQIILLYFLMFYLLLQNYILFYGFQYASYKDISFISMFSIV